MGELKLQWCGGGRRSDVKRVLRVTEIRCIGQASKVGAIPKHGKGIIRCAVLVVVGQPEVENIDVPGVVVRNWLIEYVPSRKNAAKLPE